MKTKNVILAVLLLVAAVGCNHSETTETPATTNATVMPATNAATTNAAVTNH